MSDDAIHITDDEPTKDYKLTPEEMLSEVEAGQKVSLSRHDPKWADSGWLETFPVPDGVPISLETIEQRWGGGYYEIRILRDNGHYRRAFTVRIAGPPRNKDGRLAKNPAVEEEERRERERRERERELGHGRIEQIITLAKALSPTPPPQSQSDIATIWKILESTNEKNMQFLQKLIDQKAGDTARNQFDLTQLAQSVKQIKELTGLFGNNTEIVPETTGEPAEQSWNIISQIMKWMDGGNKKLKQEEDDIDDDEDDINDKISLESMANAFSELDSEERSAVIGAALKNMTDKERSLAFKLFRDDDSENDSDSDIMEFKSDEQVIDTQ